MENISRGPTFGDFVTIFTEGSMQYKTSEYKHTDSPLAPLLNVMYLPVLPTEWESLWGQSKYSLRKKGVIGNLYISLFTL